MGTVARRLAQFDIRTFVSGIYTTPTGIKTILKSWMVCNTTASGIPLRLFLVPRDGVAGSANALCYNKNIPAEEVWGWEGEQVLEFGDSIQVQALAAGLTITLSGVEMS